MKRKEGYTVYVLETPGGNRYCGRTKSPLYVRFNGGRGFASTPGLSEEIAAHGWSSVKKVFSREGLDGNASESLVALIRAGISGGAPKTDCSAEARRIYAEGVAEGVFPPLGQRTALEVTDNKPAIPTIMKKEKKAVARAAKINGVGVELMTDNRYTDRNGGHAVVVRVYHERKYAYVPTGFSMSGAELMSCDPKTSAALNRKFDAVCAHVLSKTEESAFCIDCVKPAFEEASEVPGTLSELLRRRGCIQKGADTIANYIKAAKAVERLRPQGVPLKAVNSTSVASIAHDMETVLKYSCTTRSIYLSMIKAAVNYAIYKEWMKPSQYPFRKNAYEADKVEMPASAKRDDRWLSMTEMRSLWDAFTADPDRNAGYFLFSYLHGGMNMADIARLTFTDSYFDEGAFTFVRSKTENKSGFRTVVPVTKWTDMLLSALGITPKRGELVFAEFGNGTNLHSEKEKASNRANKALKTLSKRCGLGKPVSMTYARHTFATLATKSGMPADMRERAMSHVPGGVSSHYVGSWTVGEMRPYFEKLL